MKILKCSFLFLMVSGVSTDKVRAQTPCEPATASHADALIVSQHAVDAKFMKCQGSDQLTYSVAIPYPAQAVLDDLSTRLAKNGWNPAKESIFNPGRPNSHTSGWKQFVGGTKNPRRIVHQWLAEWQNSKYDVVVYLLRYQYPAADNELGAVLDNSDRAKLTDLSVVAQFIPASKVKLMQENPKHPKALLDVPDPLGDALRLEELNEEGTGSHP